MDDRLALVLLLLVWGPAQSLLFLAVTILVARVQRIAIKSFHFGLLPAAEFGFSGTQCRLGWIPTSSGVNLYRRDVDSFRELGRRYGLARGRPVDRVAWWRFVLLCAVAPTIYLTQSLFLLPPDEVIDQIATAPQQLGSLAFHPFSDGAALVARCAQSVAHNPASATGCLAAKMFVYTMLPLAHAPVGLAIREALERWRPGTKSEAWQTYWVVGSLLVAISCLISAWLAIGTFLLSET